MKSEIILAVQQFLYAQGINLGPDGIDGEDGPNTLNAWKQFVAKAVPPKAEPIPSVPSVPSGTAREKLLYRAIKDIGVLSTINDRGTDRGNLGCADAVSKILKEEVGLDIPIELSTAALYIVLKQKNWRLVEPVPGAVIISPTGIQTHAHGHVGIIVNDNNICSNSSATGFWTKNFTVQGWMRYFTKTFVLIPPEDGPIGPAIPLPIHEKGKASEAPIGQTINGYFFTHYGYPWDSGFDTESAKGLGDRDNKLTPNVSVALTRSSRVELFGASGHSTGKTFKFEQWTFKDDDTAPESNKRIDVYDPWYQGHDHGCTQAMADKATELMKQAGILT